MSWFKRAGDKLVLKLYIQPGAKQTCMMGLYGDALKVRLSAPSIEGRANQALVKYLAALFDVPIRQVVISKGEKSRLKVVFITGSTINPEEFYSVS